ncbi:MAG: CsiV family protein [Gammaproteobacteria bacterium]
MRLEPTVAPVVAAILFFALLGAAPLAQARWYQVEIVAFRHLDGAAADGDAERFAAPRDLPDFGNAVELIYELPDMSDEPGAAGTPIAFEALPRSALRLAGAARRLANAGGYEPLLAIGWRQPSFGVTRARRVYVSDTARERARRRAAVERGLAAVEPATALERRIEGIASIKVSRLLHIDLDFLYYDGAGEPVRLTETRRLKLREIHYFDHPSFGLLVQVSPWAPPNLAATVDPDAEPEDPGEAPAQ